MDKQVMIANLIHLSKILDHMAADIMDVRIDATHADALRLAIEELKKETVSRDTYEWEFNIRKDLDNENASLKQECKMLKKEIEALKIELQKSKVSGDLLSYDNFKIAYNKGWKDGAEAIISFKELTKWEKKK